MSMFAFYFASNLLREAGWPRKLGMFKSEGYDAVMVDLAQAQSIDWGAALGAGRPRLALEMIGEMFRDRWASDHPPNVKGFIEESADQDIWSATSPREAIRPPEFATGMRAITVKQWNEPQTRTNMEMLLFEATLWGLSHPDSFESWYCAELERRESTTPTYRTMGLDIEAPLPLPEFFDMSEEIVRDYERDIEPLHSIPPRLLDDAMALGWRV